MIGRGVVWGGGVVLALGVGWVMWPDGGSGDYRVGVATVVRAAECGAPGGRDVLRVALVDGRVLVAALNGCGHRMGEVLSVEVPDPLPTDQVVARLAGTGVPAGTATAQRLAAVEVALAGIAGALLAWRLRQVRC